MTNNNNTTTNNNNKLSLSSSSASFPKESTVVIIDPPRAWCSIEFIQQLMQFEPQRIVYVSCDPVTQARDAQILLQLTSNLYNVSHVTPFDLFPQTRHIEYKLKKNQHFYI